MTIARGIEGISYPSKLYSSLAVGRPILAISEPGSELSRTQVIDNGAGYWFELGDAEGLVDRIREMMRDPRSARRVGQRGPLAARGEVHVRGVRRDGTPRYSSWRRPTASAENAARKAAPSPDERIPAPESQPVASLRPIITGSDGGGRNGLLLVPTGLQVPIDHAGDRLLERGLDGSKPDSRKTVGLVLRLRRCTSSSACRGDGQVLAGQRDDDVERNRHQTAPARTESPSASSCRAPRTPRTVICMLVRSGLSM